MKSLIILSMVSNVLGLNFLSQKFDSAIIRDRSGSTKLIEASSLELNNLILPEILDNPTVRMNSAKPYANAQNYILADIGSSSTIVEKNINNRVPIASITKIMTAVVALENYDLSDVVTVSMTASIQSGADAYLIFGEKITFLNLLNCMLIKSGNDAAYAIAEHMNAIDESGTTKFVKKMNEKAIELQMKDTKYEDPAGLNNSGYSSAYDLFLVTKYALKNEIFASIVIKDGAVAKNIDSTIWHELKNSNRLVAEYKYPGAIGVKTGYMPEAGHTLVGAAKRDDHTLVSIVLNTYADTPSASADEAKRLLDWGFENIIWK